MKKLATSLMVGLVCLGIVLSIGLKAETTWEETIPGMLKIKEVAIPDTPSAGYLRLYANDGRLRYKNDSGTDVTPVRTATLVVAANDSSAKSKAQADYVCDGTADDVEIQAAIDTLPPPAGKVLLLEGRFNIATKISITDDNVYLIGMGRGITILSAIGALDYIIDVTGTSDNYVTKLQIVGITIDGDNILTENGIDLDYVSSFRIAQVELKNILGGFVIAEDFEDITDWTAGAGVNLALVDRDCQGNSMQVDNTTAGVEEVYKTFASARDYSGMYYFEIFAASDQNVNETIRVFWEDSAARRRWWEVTLRGHAKHSFYWDIDNLKEAGADNSWTTPMTGEDGGFDDSDVVKIGMSQLAANSIYYFDLFRERYTATNQKGRGIDGKYIEKFTIENVDFDSMGFTGIHLDAASDGTIQNINISSAVIGIRLLADSAAIERITIDNAKIRVMHDAAIKLYGYDYNITRCVVSNCIITSCHTGIVSIDATGESKFHTFSNNTLKQCSWGAISSEGLGYERIIGNIALECSGYESGEGSDFVLSDGTEHDLVVGNTAVKSAYRGFFVGIAVSKEHTIIGNSAIDCYRGFDLNEAEDVTLAYNRSVGSIELDFSITSVVRLKRYGNEQTTNTEIFNWDNKFKVNPDGEIVSQDTFENQQFLNLLRNSFFEAWSNGIAAAPDKWTAHNTVCEQEGADVKVGNYSAKLTSDGDYTYLQQDILSSLVKEYQGKTLTLGIWCKNLSANDKTQIIYLRDNVGNTYASLAKDDTWHFITLSRNIDAGATYIRVEIRVNNTASADTDDILYIDAPILVLGHTVTLPTPHPHDNIDAVGYISLPHISVATATTLTSSHYACSVDAVGGAISITLPSASGIRGRKYVIKKIDASANAVTLITDGAETVDGVNDPAGLLTAQWDFVQIMSDGTNWIIISS